MKWDPVGEKNHQNLRVTTAALRSHTSIFLVLSSALDHPLNLLVWLEFSPAVGKEQLWRPGYVYPANEPRKENAEALRQQAAQASREGLRIRKCVFHLGALYLCDWWAGAEIAATTSGLVKCPYTSELAMRAA